MKNLTHYGILLTGVLLVSCLIFSCNSKRTPSDDPDSTRLVRQIQGMGVQDSLSSSSGLFLDSLIVSDSVFAANKNKNFAFVYFIGDSTITLYGWILKKTSGGPGQFNPNPDVKLTPLGKTAISLSPNTSFGNQVLTKDKVKAIVDYIDSKKAKTNRKANLKFYPIKTVAGRIYYNITIEIIGDTIQDMIPPPTFSTNPSPPHQGFE